MINTQRYERVVELSISIPPVNVLDTETLTNLARELGSLDPGVGAVLIRGEGRCFSAGASVEEHMPDAAPAMLQALTDACMALEQTPAPTIAMVHGACLGGALELAAYCDFVVADPGATFGVPEIQLAFFPPLACARLAQLCGRQNAAQLIFTGASIDAGRAQQIGLVQQLAPVADWGRIVEQFNRLSLPVLRIAKQAFLTGSGRSDQAGIAELNQLFIDELYKTEDVHEGIASFKEKRRPEWKHR
jgi:cyclohexa-1,5-dienecarbonyl-CoA hydratase